MRLLSELLKDRTELWVVRHPAHGGGDAVFQGRGRDSLGLTEMGCRQGTALSERLSDVGFHHVYTGTFKTHEETLALLDPGRLFTPFSAPQLNERDNGTVWPGKSKVDMPNGVVKSWRDGGLIPPNGESGLMVCARVAGHIEDMLLAQQQAGLRSLIIASGTPARSMLAHLMGVPFQATQYWAVDNASLCIFKRRGGAEARWELETWNDTAHLAEIGRQELVATPT